MVWRKGRQQEDHTGSLLLNARPPPQLLGSVFVRDEAPAGNPAFAAAVQQSSASAHTACFAHIFWELYAVSMCSLISGCGRAQYFSTASNESSKPDFVSGAGC